MRGANHTWGLLFCTTAIAVLVAAACAAPAVAETAAAETAATEASATTAVTEVIITAQKRNESAVNVPISIVAVSGQNLAKSGVHDMADLATVVPGLHIDDAGAFFQPSIRGVGTAIAGAGASANVATYVDGIYKPNALSNDFDFIDVDSIQVLKGPQGTLFGRNSTGGNILVTTRAPSFTPQLEAQASYGSFNTVQGAVFGTTGLTDKIAASLMVSGDRSDGWVHNDYTGKSANPSYSYSTRVKLLFKPADGWKFTLTGDLFRVNDPSAYAASAYKGESDAANFGVPLSVGNPTHVSLSGLVAHIVEGGSIALKSEVDLGFADLTSYSAGQWQNGREATNELAAAFPTNGSAPISPALQDAVTNADWFYHENTYTQEFDLSHQGKGPVDWVAGLYYYYDDTTYEPFNLGLYGPFGPGGELSGAPYPWPASAYVNTGDLRYSGFTLPTYSGAAFADVTYNLDRWHFTVGGRYSRDRVVERFTSYPSIPDGFNSGTFVPFTVSAAHDFSSFTPRAIVRYSLTDSSNLYVSFSEGTKAGLYNSSGFLLQMTPLQPERLKDFEGGYKINGNGWRFEVSGYYYDYTNLQVSTYIGGQAFLQNAPSARIYGGEASLKARLTDNFDVSLGAAVTHARYTDFPNAALQTFSPIYGVVNSTTNVSGGPMERTPDFTGDITLNYHTPLMGGLFEFVATGTMQTQSSFDFANTIEDPGHALLNLRAAWTDASKRWTLSVNGRNVTNTVYLVQVLPNAGGFGATYGEPANVNVELRYRY